jgi:phage repressor protein C with HTH and peptisase S24 domain
LAGDNSPNIEILAKICQIYDVKMSELLNDKSDFSFSEKQHIKKYRTLDKYGKKAVDDLLETEYLRCTEIIDEPKVITLPKAELKASAGTGQWLGEDEYTEWVDVLDTPEARRANVVIEVSGDSMEPQYHNGDKVLVKLQPTVEQNEIGIFIVDNCGYIKKLGYNELISVNEAYDNIPLYDYNDVTCVGKVIGIAEVV